MRQDILRLWQWYHLLITRKHLPIALEWRSTMMELWILLVDPVFLPSTKKDASDAFFLNLAIHHTSPSKQTDPRLRNTMQSSSATKFKAKHKKFRTALSSCEETYRCPDLPRAEVRCSNHKSQFSRNALPPCHQNNRVGETETVRVRSKLYASKAKA